MKYYLLLFILSSCSLFGQKFSLTLKFEDSPSPELQKKLRLHQGEKTDSLDLLKSISKLKAEVYENGFYLSQANIIWQGKSAILHLKTGKTFIWQEPEISLTDDFPLVFSQKNTLEGKSLTSKNIYKFCDQYLNELENNGFPFAQINFTEYFISGDSIRGKIEINPGPYITLDSIIIKGFSDFSKNIIKYNLLFYKGMTYDESYLRKLSEYIEQIEFLEFERAPAVAFSRDKTLLYIYLKEKKSNQVDGIIGLNTEDNGDISFNGDFQLRLLNILKKGEEIQIRWRRPDDEVSELNMLLNLPYLFGSRFGIQGDLQIFRQDSSFVNTTTNATLKYLIESGSFLNLGIGYNSSNILLSTGEISLGSFQTISYSIGYERKSTNSFISPSKGNDLTTKIFTSKRETSESRLNQYGWGLNVAQYFSLFRSHVIKTQLNSQALIGESLFRNEIYRIGGLKTLRGFNEQSIYASAYGIASLEYRYLIGQNNYLAAFGDLAYVENQASASENIFLGLGAGINFETNGGIFSLFLAIGKDDQNPFDFRTSKIHFGYINRF